MNFQSIKKRTLLPLAPISIVLFALALMYSQPSFTQNSSSTQMSNGSSCHVVSATVPTVSNKSVFWRVFNHGDEETHLESVTLTWPDAYGELRQFKSGTISGGSSFNGSATGPTVTLSAEQFRGKRIVASGEDQELRFFFQKRYGGASIDDFEITATFSDGCSVSYIPAQTHTDCPVSITNAVEIKGKFLNWTLFNQGTKPATISAISLQWPLGQGKLAETKISGKRISGILNSDPPDATIIDGWSGSFRNRQIMPSRTKELQVRLDKRISDLDLSQYNVTVEFEGDCVLQVDDNSTVVDIEVTDGLPPDPGEAGKSTVDGIDSDGDGVRDDIQRWISITYPDQDAIQATLASAAIIYQGIMLNANDPASVLENTNGLQRVRECVSFLEGNTAGASRILSALKAEYLNTRERSLEYLTHNNNLSGEITLFRPMSSWESSCDADQIGSGDEQ